MVLAIPTAKLTPEQRGALEGYLRLGGRLILQEHEIGDSGFLSAYRHAPAPASGERVGKGTLYRVGGLGSNTLGDVFAGRNLSALLAVQFEPLSFNRSDQMDWMRRRFALSFDFPACAGR